MSKDNQIKRVSKFIFFSIVFTFIIILNVCDKQHTDLLLPSETSYFSAPHNIIATIGDTKVILTWTMASDSGVAAYYIFRKDSTTQADLVDSTMNKEYTDSSVVNGHLYIYQISAVDSNGYEGKRSSEIIARPSVYDIIIEDGKKFTNNQTVSLKLTANVNTLYMMIANDSSFNNAAWEMYSPFKSWSLTPNDGVKHVYVKFRDSEGNINQRPVHSTIQLDTRASISSITENSDGNVLAPGHVIHFSLDAGEPNGTATIDISDKKFNIRLYDDGMNGDETALDGIYELDYTIPSGLKVANGIITGHFTDRAGNIADAITAPGRISIQSDPGSVILFISVQSGSGTQALELYWSESNEDDFSTYRLFRSTSSGVDTSSKLLTTIFDKSNTSYTDSDVNANDTYYYRLFVFDRFGLVKGSNQVSGNVESNTPPTSVRLFSPSPGQDDPLTSLELTWTKNNDSDFHSYQIYQSTENSVDTTNQLLAIITDQNRTQFVATKLAENQEYFYCIYVYDIQGMPAKSNEVSGKTGINQPPSVVTLFSVSPVANSLTSLKLNWSKNEDDDFAAYQIYRSLTAGVDSTTSVVATITNQSMISYEDTGLKEDTEYFYRIFVYNTRGLFSKSNEKSGQTNSNIPPQRVTLYPIVALQDDLHAVHLNWSENTESDFSKYKIYRSTNPSVDSTSFLVKVITNQQTNEFEDTGLAEATTYYYRIYVYDEGGLGTGSNIENGTTNANKAPGPVVLATPSVLDSVTLRLSWSRNSDNDFSMYTLFRSNASISDTISTAPIAIINNQGTTEFVDTNLEPNTIFYYRIFVNDAGGLRSGSNEVHAETKP